MREQCGPSREWRPRGCLPMAGRVSFGVYEVCRTLLAAASGPCYADNVSVNGFSKRKSVSLHVGRWPEFTT